MSLFEAGMTVSSTNRGSMGRMLVKQNGVVDNVIRSPEFNALDLELE
jgi:hypothetical protein